MERLITSVLSYCVVLGAFIYKFPQIYNILHSRSADGISLIGNCVELLAASVSTSWLISQKLSFWDFGECSVITVQLLFIVALVAYYQKLKAFAFFIILCEAAIFALLLSGSVPYSVHKTLLSGQIFLNICSRIPQILMNYKNKSTGKLSFVTFFFAFGGGSARVITTIVNVSYSSGKEIIVLQNLTAVFLNFTVLAQILFYWKRNSKGKKDK